jgi:transposase
MAHCAAALAKEAAPMLVSLRDPSDLVWLDQRIAREPNAKQRDRYRVVRLALDGQETLPIARAVARSRKFVQEWVYRYRDRGRDGLVPRRQTGRRPKLPAEQHERLRQRLDAGPRDEDNVCTLRGRDIRRIVEVEFGVVYSTSGVYELLHRLDYSSLKPRPKHRKTDVAQQEQFKVDSPLLRSG